MHGLYWLAVRLAAREPLLVVVDDAHWADEPSLRFLAYLAGRVGEQPVAVLVATRPGAGGLVAHLERTRVHDPPRCPRGGRAGARARARRRRRLCAAATS